MLKKTKVLNIERKELVDILTQASQLHEENLMKNKDSRNIIERIRNNPLSEIRTSISENEAKAELIVVDMTRRWFHSKSDQIYVFHFFLLIKKLEKGIELIFEDSRKRVDLLHKQMTADYQKAINHIIRYISENHSFDSIQKSERMNHNVNWDPYKKYLFTENNIEECVQVVKLLTFFMKTEIRKLQMTHDFLCNRFLRTSKGKNRRENLNMLFRFFNAFSNIMTERYAHDTGTFNMYHYESHNLSMRQRSQEMTVSKIMRLIKTSDFQQAMCEK